MTTFLVTAELTVEGLQELHELGTVIYEPWTHTGRLLQAEALAEMVVEREIDVLIVEVDLVHEEVFEARPLRAVGCCRGQPINVDLEAAEEHGVPVVCTPGRNAPAVADLTLAFILNLARQLVPLDRRLSEGRYAPPDLPSIISELRAARGFEIGDATVGLLGLGAVGREVAARLRGFGSTLIATDPGVSDAVFDQLAVRRVDLNTLFAQSDVLSLHCEVNGQTRRVVDAERIASMKDGAVLVNTARPALLDDEAVLEALRSGKLAGIALDVFRVEPPLPDDPYLRFPNVICTPHIGGATHGVIERQTRMLVPEIKRVLAGDPARRRDDAEASE